MKNKIKVFIARLSKTRKRIKVKIDFWYVSHQTFIMFSKIKHQIYSYVNYTFFVNIAIITCFKNTFFLIFSKRNMLLIHFLTFFSLFRSFCDFVTISFCLTFFCNSSFCFCWFRIDEIVLSLILKTIHLIKTKWLCRKRR